ncbi:uracil-DNA glycosylase-like protein [Boeremia exigua]|uniref:uracil-DNA glycosylase-like protein n=1 Tax=Boeremia exigua TaxID=749465 RepID=UPI001E8E21E2|nr:uracil-DNA glycosylase-like protein [Boeremia exigua]KAH6642999.1 uracil-DNA glycosylase-like protein [Boeremia exigua]
MKTEDSSKTMLSSDNELPDPPEALSSQPPASFKGRIAKYEYTNSSAKEDQTPSSASPARPAKRLRTTSVTATKATPSPRAAKKQRKSSKYADPSQYAHLSPLVDILEPNLVCVFVGTNPGVSTALHGHAYAHPSNHFWKLLHSSGLTERRLAPSEDRSLPAQYCMGNTNIVERPSKDAAQLSKEEMTEGTRELERKFALYRPEAVCIVGKGIWEAVWRFRYGRSMSKGEFAYGWQDERHNMGMVEGEWKGSKVFVTTSTSGLAASLKPAEKEAIWKPFGEWVQRRREERGFVPGGIEEEVKEEVKEERAA